MSVPLQSLLKKHDNFLPLIRSKNIRLGQQKDDVWRVAGQFANKV